MLEFERLVFEKTFLEPLEDPAELGVEAAERKFDAYFLKNPSTLRNVIPLLTQFGYRLHGWGSFPNWQ